MTVSQQRKKIWSRRSVEVFVVVNQGREGEEQRWVGAGLSPLDGRAIKIGACICVIEKAMMAFRISLPWQNNAECGGLNVDYFT
jgi:hypothetical protein